MVREVPHRVTAIEGTGLHQRSVAVSGTVKMRVFTHQMLLALNRSSVEAGRRQNLRPERLTPGPVDRYWVTAQQATERDGDTEVRLCVVLDLFTGQTAWLDVSVQEFEAVPEVDVPYMEWETAMCAGTPPPAP